MHVKHLAATGAGVVLLVAITATHAPAIGNYGPDTCLEGYVWRGVTLADHVCVRSSVRDQVAADNQQPDAHRNPDGTCASPYVPRNAVANDSICVAPATRQQVVFDNQRAALRRNSLRTTLGTYYRGDSPRYRLTTDHINLGTAVVVLYKANGAKIASWSKPVADDPAVPGGRLTLRTGQLVCNGGRDAYFKVRDPSSGRWSAPVYIALGCVVID